MRYRLRNVVLAVALAALAALLTSFYVTNYKRSVQASEEDVAVWVAAQEIPAGTTGAQAFDRGLVRREEVARRTVVPGAISDPTQVGALVAVETVYEGEQLSVRRFQPVEAAGVRAELKGNLRALQLAGDANQLLAGTLRKGDHVDVVVSMRYRVKDIQPLAEGDAGADMERIASRVALRDLLVLRAPVGSFAAAKLEGNSSTYAVQLAVTDAQAQKLFFVSKNSDWSLQLRPVVDAADSPESVETIESVLGDGLRGPQYAELYGRRDR